MVVKRISKVYIYIDVNHFAYCNFLPSIKLNIYQIYLYIFFYLKISAILILLHYIHLIFCIFIEIKCKK